MSALIGPTSQVISHTVAASGGIVMPPRASRKYCGQIYLIAELEAGNGIIETDYSNNILARNIHVGCERGMGHL